MSIQSPIPKTYLPLYLTPQLEDQSCSICFDQAEEFNPIVAHQCFSQVTTLMPDGSVNTSAASQISHLFHKKCILEWVETLQKKKNEPDCPICRKKFTKLSIEELKDAESSDFKLHLLGAKHLQKFTDLIEDSMDLSLEHIPSSWNEKKEKLLREFCDFLEKSHTAYLRKFNQTGSKKFLVDLLEFTMKKKLTKIFKQTKNKTFALIKNVKIADTEADEQLALRKIFLQKVSFYFEEQIKPLINEHRPILEKRISIAKRDKKVEESIRFNAARIAMVGFQFAIVALLVNVANRTHDDEARLFAYKIIAIIAPMSLACCLSLFHEMTSEEHYLAVRLEKISIKD
jgi:hypothetical protein